MTKFQKTLLISLLVIAANKLIALEKSAYTADQERYKKFFQPQVGEKIHIDHGAWLSKRFKKEPENLVGYIKVTPPKGSCLVVQRNVKERDLYICKNENIEFRIADFDWGGKLKWIVKDDFNPFGTEIVWPSDYRVGRVVMVNMSWPSESLPLVIKDCQYEKSSAQITISFFYQGDWKIDLPKKLEIDDPPKEKKPQLYFQKQKAASTFIKVGNSTAVEDDDPNTILSTWQIHPRDGYKIPTQSVRIGENSPVFPRARCRFSLQGFQHAMENGALECHHYGGYRWLYVPLSCGMKYYKEKK